MVLRWGTAGGSQTLNSAVNADFQTILQDAHIQVGVGLRSVAGHLQLAACPKRLKSRWP